MEYCRVHCKLFIWAHDYYLFINLFIQFMWLQTLTYPPPYNAIFSVMTCAISWSISPPLQQPITYMRLQQLANNNDLINSQWTNLSHLTFFFSHPRTHFTQICVTIKIRQLPFPFHADVILSSDKNQNVIFITTFLFF